MIFFLLPTSLLQNVLILQREISFQSLTYSGQKFFMVLCSVKCLAYKSSVTDSMQITLVSFKQELIMKQFDLSSQNLHFIHRGVTLQIKSNKMHWNKSKINKRCTGTVCTDLLINDPEKQGTLYLQSVSRLYQLD